MYMLFCFLKLFPMGCIGLSPTSPRGAAPWAKGPHSSMQHVTAMLYVLQHLHVSWCGVVMSNTWYWLATG